MGGLLQGLGWLRARLALAAAVTVGILLVGLAALGPASATHLEEPLTESVVTGHTVLASNYGAGDGPRGSPDEEGPSVPSVRLDADDEASPPSGRTRNECVTWFNGAIVFDGTVGSSGLDWDSSPGAGFDDRAQANDNALDPCGSIIGPGFIGTTRPTDFAVLAGLEMGGRLVVAVESGDCDPNQATAALFARDLSFVDPLGQAHLVAEIRYTCFYEGLLSQFEDINEGELGQSIPGHVPNSPQSGDGDPLLSDGQRRVPEGLGPLNETFVEYAWVTQVHAVILDPSLNDGDCFSGTTRRDAGYLGADPTGGLAPDDFEAGPVSGDPWDDDVPGGYDNPCVYNYALIVDTCNDATANDTGRGRSSANRCTDGGGEEFFQDDDDADGNPVDPREAIGARFDDSARRLTAHTACPTGWDAVRDGNSNRAGLDAWPGCADNHREDKTADEGADIVNAPPGGPSETDYDAEEDHLTVDVDVYVLFEECIAPYSVVGTAFCDNFYALTPLFINHPGCWEPEDDATVGDVCWNPLGQQDDAAGAGGRDLIEDQFE